MIEDLLFIKNLKVYFFRNKNLIKAIDGIELNLKEGFTTALVGESGCGKTTVAKTILQFVKPRSGKIYFQGQDITIKKNESLIRENIQMVFQNPYLSLDPRYTVFSTLYEALRVFKKITQGKAKNIIIDLLQAVELNENILYRKPDELSGGQRQRICIARSLINKPKLIILDEPTSSLDITTAIKILELLKKIQKEFKLTFLFISHDLRLLRKIADFFYVMYRGKIVEFGPREDIFNNPKHPYTQILKQAAYQKLHEYPAYKESLADCPFYSNCSFRLKECLSECNEFQIEKEHFVFCNKFKS